MSVAQISQFRTQTEKFPVKSRQALQKFISKKLSIESRSRRARRNQMSAEEQMLSEPSMYTNVQNWAGDLISGNTTTGRILVVFAFACSIAALVLYIWGKSSLFVTLCQTHILLSRAANLSPLVYEIRDVARRVVPLFSITWPPLETLPCSPRRVRALPPRSFASKILVRPSRITLVSLHAASEGGLSA